MKFTFWNSISPLSILVIYFFSLASIFEGSSIMLNILPAATFALADDGALEIYIPLPIADMKIKYTQIYTS
jgi:hypothetical protein